MGQGMPAPITSVVVKQSGNETFRVGLAEMNGWRTSMEDAHVIHAQETWGFFGIFDGHGGHQCSAFIARRLSEELAKGPPADDAAMAALCRRLDAEFLATDQAGGSTGTFVLTEAPAEDDGKWRLRVGNVGDSRVLLCRNNGTMVEGPGSDGALTYDHKPDDPAERERIENAGSVVESNEGVPRVNGDLALSRAFGDARFKKVESLPPERQAVCATPDLRTFECDSTDFLLLVCDGISEGNFPNREVAQLAAKKLSSGRTQDPGEAAVAVCRRALKRGSRDNLSCMVVLLSGGAMAGPSAKLLPGPFDPQKGHAFICAYAAMAARAGLTLTEAIAMRYATIEEELDALQFEGGSDEDSDMDVSLSALNAELAAFGDGPPPHLASGSAERLRWFESWLHRSSHADSSLDASTDSLIDAELESLSRVRVAPLAEVQTAIDENAALEWDDNLADACGQEGFVLVEDESDGTSQVRFSADFIVWLPTCVLTKKG